MHNELSDRQAAIRRRLAGESVESICQTLQRCESWFHKWWQRYLSQGPEGLYDLTRANHQVINRTPPHIERAVISIRRRLAARAIPQTRYTLVGAAQIRAELKALGYAPLPALRTIEAIITRAGLSCPPLRLARRLAQSEYPGPVARDSNEVHQVWFWQPGLAPFGHLIWPHPVLVFTALRVSPPKAASLLVALALAALS